MPRKEKCRRVTAGTTTAVLKPQLEQPSFSTTITPRQEPLSPHPANAGCIPLSVPIPILGKRHPLVGEPLSCS